MSIETLGLFGGGSAMVAVLGGLYAMVLKRYAAVHAAAVDKRALIADAPDAWSRFLVRLSGWRTVALAGIAGLAQVLPPLLGEVLPAVKDLPWMQVVDGKVATWITIVCTVLIPLTHMQGLARASEAEPPNGF